MCRGDGFGNLVRQRMDALNSHRLTNVIVDRPDGGVHPQSFALARSANM